jgi:hypothetical protein
MDSNVEASRFTTDRNERQSNAETCRRNRAYHPGLYQAEISRDDDHYNHDTDKFENTVHGQFPPIFASLNLELSLTLNNRERNGARLFTIAQPEADC